MGKNKDFYPDPSKNPYRVQPQPQLKENLVNAEKVEKLICPFCGEEMDNRGTKTEEKICPFCGERFQIN